MFTEEQIEKLSEEFKEKLRKGNTEKLNNFYDKESWVLEQGKSMEQKTLEEVASCKSKKKLSPMPKAAKVGKLQKPSTQNKCRGYHNNKT
ncbi:MAG: hypothetical protein OEV78_10225, partial [Spirochaetia bacterium]|nr:hypothetical protein [Spirochaetia bacterium]